MGLRTEVEHEGGRVHISFVYDTPANQVDGVTVRTRNRATVSIPAKYLSKTAFALRCTKAAADEGEDGDDESIDLAEGELVVSSTPLPVASGGRR